MLNKDFIIKTIESDNDFNDRGRYCRDFMDDDHLIIHEYQHDRKLGRLLAFSGNEMTWKLGSFTTIVTIVADDHQQLLLKEIAIDDGGKIIIIEFWLVDKARLTADKVWDYI